VRALRRLAILLSVLTVPLAAAAQEPAGPLRLRGITFDHWDGAGGAALLRPTLRATNLTRGPLGSDFALVMFPDGISIRPLLVTAGLQAGLAYRIAIGPVSLLPRGGGAAIVAAGGGGEQLLHIVPGVQWGLGLLVPVDAKSLIRADLTRHLYTSNGRSVGFWSVGFGFAAPLRGAASPRRSRASCQRYRSSALNRSTSSPPTEARLVDGAPSKTASVTELTPPSSSAIIAARAWASGPIASGAAWGPSW